MTKVLAVQEDTLTTRQKAEQLVKEARDENCEALDLTGVEFMTRSVADELRYFQERGEIELRGLRGSAKEIYEVVSGQETIA